MVGDGTWLTMGEVMARIRAAGLPDSADTIRRMVDAGQLKAYRQRDGRGHRRISAASVDELIRRRTQQPE